MTNLSPAAQAVIDAGMGHSGPAFEPLVRRLTAAAIRAVAEHCVPDDSEGHWVYIPHVLAIATELEAE